MQHVHKQIQRSVMQYPERSPEALDRIDREIEAAVREDRQIRLDHAFPHPAAHPRRMATSFSRIVLNPGASGIEPVSEEDTAKVEFHDVEYVTEFRLVVVHRMSLWGAPLGQIGALLGISARHAQRLFDKLTDRLLSEAKQSDIAASVGETLAFYHAVRSECMRIAAMSTDASIQLNAMEIALTAEADKHRFLQACGFYDHARYVPQTVP